MWEWGGLVLTGAATASCHHHCCKGYVWGDEGDNRCWQLVPLAGLLGGRCQPQAQALVSFYSILHSQKHLELHTSTAIQGLWWGQAL